MIFQVLMKFFCCYCCNQYFWAKKRKIHTDRQNWKIYKTFTYIYFNYISILKNWPFLVVFEKKIKQKYLLVLNYLLGNTKEKSLEWILNSNSKKSFMTSNWCCKFIKQISQKCEQTHVQTYVYFGKNRKKNIQKVVRFNCCIKMSVHVFYCIKHL